jgi:hypothetical protein
MGPRKKRLGFGESGSIVNTMIHRLNKMKWHKKAIRKEVVARNLVFMK